MLAILRRWHRSSTAIWLFVRLRSATTARVRAERAADRAHVAHSEAEDRLLSEHGTLDDFLRHGAEPACLCLASECLAAARRSQDARARLINAMIREERLISRVSAISKDRV